MGLKQLFLVAIILVSNISFAAVDDDNGWMLYTDSSIGSLYIHPESIAVDVFDNRMMWIKVVNPTPEDGVKTTKTLSVYDCNSKKQETAHIIQYDNDNNIIKEYRLPTIIAPKNTLDPDSFHYTMLKVLC